MHSRAFLFPCVAVVSTLMLIGCAPRKTDAQLREEVRAGLLKGCKGNSSSPAASLFEPAQYEEFCGCAAAKASAELPLDEVRAALKSGDISSLTEKVKKYGKDCAEPILEKDFRGVLKRVCLQNVGNGLDPQKARDFCACNSYKAEELLGPEGRRQVIADAGEDRIGKQEMAKMKEAAVFCRQTL